MSDDLAKPPRFPYVAALLCAACVGMAGYLWIRYSYAWPYHTNNPQSGVPLRDTYMKVVGTIRAKLADGGVLVLDEWTSYNEPTGANDACRVMCAVPYEKADMLIVGRSAILRGRYVGFSTSGSRYDFCVDTTASRFTGASVAGLVVGAMGVFVFTVALRHWLRERRKFREEARA